MYRQTNASRMTLAPRIPIQAAILLFGVVMSTASCVAQTLPANVSGNPVGYVSPVNATAINQEDSSAPSEVNLTGSSQPAEVNRTEASSLPDAPDAISPMVQNSASAPGGPRMTPIYKRTIPPGWAAQPLTTRDKQILGLRDLYSSFSLLDYVTLSAYSHLTNGQPNYGTNSEAYGKRVGATLLRDVSEGIFMDVVFAPMLHQDMRYYMQGPQDKLLHRVGYAITRPLIGRTDSGRATINSARLLGYASASALTYTYYPRVNQNFHDTAATFGFSLMGNALGNLVREFSGQLLEAVHLKKPD
jgi:hypothetical protein